jgi:hypothetical protein
MDYFQEKYWLVDNKDYLLLDNPLFFWHQNFSEKKFLHPNQLVNKSLNQRNSHD